MEKCKSLITYATQTGGTGLQLATHRCEHPVGHKGVHSDGLCTWTRAA